MKIDPKLNIRLLAFILLPVLTAVCVMVWSTYQMLDAIAVNVNKQEEARSWQAANSAIYSVQKNLEGIVADNAHWDDAVPNIYGSLNEDWVQVNWGVSTADSNYDAMFVVDQFGKTLAAYRHGEKIDLSARAYFGPAVENLLSSSFKKSDKYKVTGSIVKTSTGVAAVASGPILPYSADIPFYHQTLINFIIVKDITPSVASELGSAFILDKFVVVPAQYNSERSHVMNDQWGNPVAFLTWSSRDPGKAARESNYLASFAGLLALIIVMGPLAYVHLGTLKKMQLNEKESYLSARKDNLSSLPNRLHLIEETNLKLPFANNTTHELALAFIDLDGFKAVNDTYGHEIGDSLIKVVATGLAKIAKYDAIVVRLGGDEFALFICGANALETAKKLADQVLLFAQTPFDINGRLVNIGASIGLASCSSPDMELSEFLRRADIAMYDAKESGRNRWRVFNTALDDVRNEDMQIVLEMRNFIQQDLMEVAYQPFVSSQNRSIIGVEALARWPKSSKRVIGPDRFVKLAEQHGLIDALGMRILQKALVDMANWQDLKVAVNFSPLQIRRPELVAEIVAAAKKVNFDLRRLEVELTESVLILNPERAQAVIKDLQIHGITVALDDFGTGYACVGYLHKFSFDKIKLDRSLTHSLSNGDMTHNIVHGTVLIAKGLSADVIAEGVETEHDANLMRLAGCELLQGYYFGKPQNLVTLNQTLLSKESFEKSVSA